MRTLGEIGSAAVFDLTLATNLFHDRINFGLKSLVVRILQSVHRKPQRSAQKQPQPPVQCTKAAPAT